MPLHDEKIILQPVRSAPVIDAMLNGAEGTFGILSLASVRRSLASGVEFCAEEIEL